MSAETKRLFLGLPLPVDCAETLLAAVAERCAGGPLQCYQPADMHLTVRFLADVPIDRVDRIIERVDAAIKQCKAPAVELSAIHFFSGRHHHLMVVLAKLSLELALLYRTVNAALVDCGFELDKRPFRPHVTVMRNARDIDVTEERLEQRFTSPELILYETVNAEGLRYRPLRRFDLLPSLAP